MRVCKFSSHMTDSWVQLRGFDELNLHDWLWNSIMHMAKSKVCMRHSQGSTTCSCGVWCLFTLLLMIRRIVRLRRLVCGGLKVHMTTTVCPREILRIYFNGPSADCWALYSGGYYCRKFCKCIPVPWPWPQYLWIYFQFTNINMYRLLHKYLTMQCWRLKILLYLELNHEKKGFCKEKKIIVHGTSWGIHYLVNKEMHHGPGQE